MRTKTIGLAVATAAFVAAAGTLGAGPATGRPAPQPVATGLPVVASGARPGPDVLYAPAPAAPQLENRNPAFVAPPLLVSGTEAYVAGEHLYQDHLYDDYGADTDGSGGSSLTERAGDVDYPDDAARYGGNAADLLELRTSTLDPGAVTYRLTLNTLLAPDAAIAAIAFDTDGDAATGSTTLPRDPGATFAGIDEVITTWGTGAEHARLSADGEPVTTPVSVTADLVANQLTVTVPRTVSDPTGAWTAVVAIGVHDPATGGWLQPDGAPSGIYNLGFRFEEPVLTSNVPPDTAQAEALAAGDAMAFAHPIDFDALAARTSSSTVPTTGTMVRIFPSRLALGEGRDLTGTPAYLGQLQPYSVYVPEANDGATPLGLTLGLHSLGQQHWQYNGSLGIQQIGEGRDNVVVTPLGRGPDGWYQAEAEYDVFEVWNDLARHVPLDPTRVAISGYSMGGYGTYRLGGLYPDLFGKAFSVVGPPGDGIWLPPLAPSGGIETLSNLWLENNRNLPYLNVAASADELVPYVGPLAQNLGNPALGIRGFEQLGYRFRFVTYTPAEHFTLAVLGYDIPMAPEFLGTAAVDRDPFHVTFAYLPATDDPALGLVHDHAYWVSGVQVADDAPVGSTPAKGMIDAFSHARGKGDPASVQGADGGVGPLPYTEVNRSWGPAPTALARNALTVTLTNVGSARIDTARAGLDPTRQLAVTVTADAPGALHLDGPFTGATRVTVDGAAVTFERTSQGITLPVAPGTATYVLSGKGRR